MDKYLVHEGLCKILVHEGLCKAIHNVYKAKNKDYGDSFSSLRKEFPEAILIRLGDKYNRLKSLMSSGKAEVKDESVEDTLLDLANYCLMEIVERRTDKNEKAKEKE
jgi:hypothetical protein